MPHSARRIIAAVIAAVALAGCGSVSVSSPPLPSHSPPATALTSPEALSSPSGSMIPWIDATPTPVPPPTAVPIPSGTETCAPGDLTATAGWQGATGQMVGWLTLTNVGQRTCVLNGSPRLVQLRSGDAILDTVTYKAGKDAGPGNETGAAGPVLLRPGDQAGAFLSWTNVCSVIRLGVTALLVTLPDGGSPIVAGSAGSGGIGGSPRCDQPGAGSTFTAYAVVPVAPPEPPYEPQAASVVLSVPPTTTAGADLVFLVTLTNLGSKPASLTPCPTYIENLSFAGHALQPPGPQQFLLNCAALGDALAPGASVTLQMHYAVPTGLGAGPADLSWGLDPGGPLGGSTATAQASLTIVGP